MPGSGAVPYQPRPKPSPLIGWSISRAPRLWSIRPWPVRYSSQSGRIGLPKYPSQRHTRELQAQRLEAAADALEVDRADADQGARDALQGGRERRVVLARDREAVDDQAGQHGADHRADERADDAAPEAVRDPDRAVPDGQADHDPHEHAHQAPPPVSGVAPRRALATAPPPVSRVAPPPGAWMGVIAASRAGACAASSAAGRS